MRHLSRVLALSLALATLAAPLVADAKGRSPRVVWSAVTVRDGKDRDHHEKTLGDILKKEGRRHDWGKRDEPVEATVEVKELTSVVEGDVVRVTCTAVGRLKGGHAAKSKFSFGGRPSERAKLEKHVLELVARGIVTRLSEMARVSVRTAPPSR
jgi:hypothetical protein